MGSVRPATDVLMSAVHAVARCVILHRMLGVIARRSHVNRMTVHATSRGLRWCLFFKFFFVFEKSTQSIAP